MNARDIVLQSLTETAITSNHRGIFYVDNIDDLNYIHDTFSNIFLKKSLKNCIDFMKRYNFERYVTLYYDGHNIIPYGLHKSKAYEYIKITRGCYDFILEGGVNGN